jgi:hypothetical protein
MVFHQDRYRLWPVKSPPTVALSPLLYLHQPSAHRFTAVTVKVMLAGSHNTGIPASHNVYGNVATH